MTSPENARQKKTWITEGIIIASTPILGYLLTFIYEKGFAEAFNIPISFISPNLTTVFVVTSALVVVFLFLSWSVLLLIDLNKD
jgi:hypothetical protein